MVVFTNNITSISPYPKSEEHWPSFYLVRNYKKKIGRKFLFFPIYEVVEEAVIRGILSSSDFYCELKDFQSSRYYFDGDKLYNKPHCDIKMNDGKVRTKWFETEEELEAFVKDLASKAPHIEI